MQAGLAASLWAGAALAQTPPETAVGPPNWAAMKAFSDQAHTIGGDRWQPAADYFCTPGPRVNAVTDPAIEPVKLFDNLYALGDEGTVVYAVTTPGGIVLIDSLYPAKLESTLLPQMARLGLDPAQVKYVLITHGHADHYGGSGYFQSKFGAHVALSAKDWEMVAAAKPAPNVPSPTRDIVAEDGKPVTIAGVAFTPVEIPGHTPGSLGWIFPVKEGGKTHVAALFGSSILRTERLTPANLAEEYTSLNHFAATAAKLKADVELQNHPFYDRMWEKVAALKTRSAGQPNPFVVGPDGYRRYAQTVGACLKAAIARKGGKPPA
jgi:glyoxylase-like metal-dependent hydrolase (beta-lactamase superfamily II)